MISVAVINPMAPKRRGKAKAGQAASVGSSKYRGGTGKKTSKEAKFTIVNGVKWNEKEKYQLLVTMRKHGVTNMDALVKAVPTKTKAKIQDFIASSMRYARMKKEVEAKGYQKMPAVEQWLRIIEGQCQTLTNYNFSRLIGDVMDLVSSKLQLPSVQEAGGIDFPLLYKYMGFAFRGEPLPDLPPPTALFLLQCLDILGSTMLKLDSENAEKFLFSFRSNVESAKRYGQDRRDADEGKEPITVLPDFDLSSEASTSSANGSTVGMDAFGDEAPTGTRNAVPTTLRARASSRAASTGRSSLPTSALSRDNLLLMGLTPRELRRKLLEDVLSYPGMNPLNIPIEVYEGAERELPSIKEVKGAKNAYRSVRSATCVKESAAPDVPMDAEDEASRRLEPDENAVDREMGTPDERCGEI
ncbi:unnamed protein product [Darwinula stevensoni]|uniref:Uncharacterized protein n=1 Tax=Darwinula stevensoni TaxID=69355 RepID=A0A7R9AFQ0_9CRUS|nr:unnamed protein product [Darwinula stevensoni]CAG0903235.1 unnamed protein product [Darwinula stevensoni]